MTCFFFFSSRRRHTRSTRDWSSDVCSSDLGWLTIENHSSSETSCLVDGYFNTPFRIGVGNQIAVQPEGSGAIDWVACGGDVSKRGFPGAVSISGLGWQPGRANLVVTFLGDSFTVAAG